MGNELDEQKIIFGRNLSNQLAERDLSQADLARALNISAASVAYWCMGKKMPRMDKIQAICDYLFIKKSDLIEDSRSEDEQILVELHKMNPALKKHVLEYMRLLNKEENANG